MSHVGDRRIVSPGEDWLESIRRHCPTVSFADGEVIRQYGRHYSNMYYIVEGAARIQPNRSGGPSKTTLVGPGSPIGEIGFLYGRKANATVTADSGCCCLEIVQGSLQAIEAENPDMAVRFLRRLADISQNRQQSNELIGARWWPTANAGQVTVVLCRDPDLLRQVRQLRYAVYCQELGRLSPHADHGNRTISDELDTFAHVFAAIIDDQLAGTLRLNMLGEGSVEPLESLYGCSASPHYPDHVGIVSKFVIAPTHRGGTTALKLISAVTRFGDNYGATECYIDCVPPLLHYYRALGFRPCGPPFMHRENGTSIPLMLDLLRSGDRLKRDPGPLGLASLYARAKWYKTAQRLGLVASPALAGATPR